MSTRKAAWLAWSLWSLFIALTAAFVLLAFLDGSSKDAGLALATLPLATFPTVGALVASRRPHNPIGWLMLAIALSFAGSSFAYQYASYALITARGAVPGGLVMAWLSTWVGLPGSILLLTFFFLLFPTGHLLAPRWRAMAWLAGAVLVLAPLTKAFTPGNASWANAPFRNPLGMESAGAFLQWLNGIFQLSGIPIGVLCAASTVLRFRQARGEERQQLKWFAYAILLIVLFYAVNLAAVLNPALKPALSESVADMLFGLVISLLAIAIGIAVLKYRLYDIDLIIRRTLIYGVLTASLAFVYFGSVVFLQQLFRALTGQSSELAIIVSTLAIAALFVPLRRRVQNIIDRRFYRRKYDAQKVLAEFAATARDEVDLNQLSERLLDVVDETMQPAQVSLWLRPTEREVKR